MKKLLLCLTMFSTILGLTACKAEVENGGNSTEENGGNNTEENVNYSELSSTNNQENVYNKMVVSNLEEISRQENVLEDPTVTSLYDIPGNGTIESNSSKKTAILTENEDMYNYDYLDDKGVYYLEGVSTSVLLYKHRGADSQVASYLLNDTAVTKTMTLRNSIYPTTETEILASPVNMTGLYAPAGELIKIEISEELAKLNPKVYIGATSVCGYTNDISSSDSYSRMPNRVKELTLSKTINYVGSPLGGQIYIQADKDEYDITITGAVEYMHYICDYTSREELVRLYDSSAPMIDIEIPEFLRINMPKDEINQRENEIYNELTLNLDLSDKEIEEYRSIAKETVIDEIIETTKTWKMYAELSSYICPSDLYRSNNITIFYDSYVVSNNAEIGKAFSTFSIAQGRNLLNSSYDNTSTLEIFYLHFWNNSALVEQGSSNITSKVLSILTNMLYGQYGQYRTAQTNTDIYSSAGDTLNYVKNSTGTTHEIAKYITLVHSFGVETFIEAITMDVEESVIKDRLYVQFSLTTKTNMQFYFEEVLGWTINDFYKEEIKDKNYDMYIPVASNLQIGSVVNNEKIYNVQAYGLFTSQNYNINENIIVPKDMEFTIEEISSTKGDLSSKDGIYYYKTTLEEIDEFTVKVKVYNDDYHYTTTLLMGVATQYSTKTITSSTTTLYNNVDDLSIDNINVDLLGVNTSFTLANSELKYNVTTGYNGVFVTYAELYFPTTKEYTLTALGLGDMRVYIGTDYNDFTEVVNYKKEESASGYDKTDESRTFTIDANQNERVVIKIVISTVAYNSNQRTEFKLGYVNGNTITDIPDSWWYGQYTANPIVTTPTTSFYNNQNNVAVDDVIESELELNTSFTLDDSILKYGVNTGYNGVFVTYAEMYVPEDGTYTFTACGLGDIRVYIGDDFENLTEVVNHKVDSSASSYDVNDDTRTFTVDAKSTKRIAIKIVVSSGIYQSNQRAEFYLGYQNGDVVSDVPSSWWYGPNSFKDEIITTYYKPYYNESLFTFERKITSFTSVDDDVTIIYQTGKLDDKFLTTPNSDKQSIDPGSIVIYKYENFVTANYFQLTSASDTDGVLSFFEIYVSDNGVNWTEAFNGVNPYESTTCVALNDGYTFQYVKLVFVSQYSGNYIDICNFEFQTRCENLTVIDSPDNFLYTGEANLVDSQGNLNNNLLEFNDRLKFSFTGTSLIIFGNKSDAYGVIEVTIDDYSFVIDLSSEDTLYTQQLLTLACLENKTHDVTIKVISGTANIDFIAVG